MMGTRAIAAPSPIDTLRNLVHTLTSMPAALQDKLLKFAASSERAAELDRREAAVEQREARCARPAALRRSWSRLSPVPATSSPPTPVLSRMPVS
jgi:hypothetical protein